MASVEINQMLAAATAACEDKKAEDIRILALDPAESGLTDYFLICTGSNDRQTVAITDEIELRLKREFSTYPNSVEGRRQGEWILMDYVDFIVHVFLPEKRAYYGLERLRPSSTTLSLADLNAEITAAIAAQRSGKGAKATAKKPATKIETATSAKERTIEKATGTKPISTKVTTRKLKVTDPAPAAAKKVAAPKTATKSTASSAKKSAKKVAPRTKRS